MSQARQRRDPPAQRGDDAVTRQLEQLETLYEEVDRAARHLAERHGDRLQCRRGCSPCCIDELTVFEVEAVNIQRARGRLLGCGRPHPEGACAFLDSRGSCRIYALRPYVCRTQGLPLRWRAVEPNGEVTEYRDICPLNEAGTPLESLAGDDCWLIGPWEARLAALQHQLDGGRGSRVELRSLFRRHQRG